MNSQPSAEFNPYYEWLSIPASEQPADYYRLLGLPRFEHNERVIANAYDQKMYFLRTKQLGNFVQLSQRLQNEITVAQRVLLNPVQRAVYDAQLTAAAATPVATVPIAAVPIPIAAVPLPVAARRPLAALAAAERSLSPPIVVAAPQRTRKVSAKKATLPLAQILGLVFGLISLACVIALLVVSGGDLEQLLGRKAVPVQKPPTRPAKAPQPVPVAAAPLNRPEAVQPQPTPKTDVPAVTLPVVPPKSNGDFALRFDGVDDRVDLPNLHYRGEFPLTLETWAVLRRGADENFKECLICDLEQAGVVLGNQLNFNPPRPYKWGCAVYADRYQSATEQAPLPRDTLIHLAGVFVPGRHVQFYLNGKLQSSTTISVPFKSSPFPLVIGANPQPDRFDSFFAGEISALRISSNARYVQDFTPERHLPADSDTLAIYRFEEGTGDKLIDSSGHGYHGKIVGATWGKSREPAE